MSTVATLEDFLAALPEEDRNLLVVDDASLQDAFVTWPGAFAWMNERLAQADAAFQRARLASKRARAEVFVRYSNPPPGGKKPSDELIKQLVEVDPHVNVADDEEITADEARARIKGLVEAFAGQRDMLVQRGARARAELVRPPQINT